MSAIGDPANPPNDPSRRELRPLPLSGVGVVEVGNLIAAPYAGMMMADLGADVVKIEPPGGDLGRRFGPWRNGESVFFLSVNRGKTGEVIDFRSEIGRRRARDIVEGADVLIHNLRAGAIERLGLGEADVRDYNPTIVYGVVSAFGAEGPYAGRAGIDIVFQAESGMISVTGAEGDPPAKTATTIGDYVAATNLVAGVCAALAEPGRPGRRIDVALRDSLIAVQGGWNAIGLHTGSQPPRIGTASIFTAPNQVFETANGHIALAIISDPHFALLCDALGRQDLARRYPANDDRMGAVPELEAALAPIFAAATSEHWIETLGDIGLPIGRVLTFPEVWDDAQVQHNEMVVAMAHPVAGEIRLVGSPIRIDGRTTTSTRPPPTLD
jgi:crotonobetainyl-CoA:carnitine CoA-transferase CaiB-like acyl-CoA transferase